MKKKLFNKYNYKTLLIAVALMFSSLASATPLTHLPESSFWQGRTFYNDDNLSVRIEFAVYDTQAETYQNAFTGQADGFVNPGTGQYIYAYQIFTNPDTDYAAVASFAIPNIDLDAVSGIGSQNDLNGGLEPENGGSDLMWEFLTPTLVDGEHSFFLVFSSNAGPVAGTYEINPHSGVVVPDASESVPEPTTAAMFLLGTALLRGTVKNLSHFYF